MRGFEPAKWLKTVISVDNSVEIVDNFFAVEKSFVDCSHVLNGDFWQKN